VGGFANGVGVGGAAHLVAMRGEDHVARGEVGLQVDHGGTVVEVEGVEIDAQAGAADYAGGGESDGIWARGGADCEHSMEAGFALVFQAAGDDLQGVTGGGVEPCHYPEVGVLFKVQQAVGEFGEQLHRRGCTQGRQVFPIGDGAANNIGSRCVTKDRAALMVGTSGALRVAYRGEPPTKIPDGLWCYRIDRGHVIVGGALSDGGGLYSWLKENLRLPANAEKLIAGRPPASHRLAFMPFLAGERSTGYNENAQGAVLGLTAATSAVDIAQAAMESVGYRFAEILDKLNSVTKVDEIYASGGALRSSKAWTQVMADILGHGLTLVDVPEASLRGAVLLALESLGNIESIEEISLDRGKVFEPNADHHAAHKLARKRHSQIYDSIVKNR